MHAHWHGSLHLPLLYKTDKVYTFFVNVVNSYLMTCKGNLFDLYCNIFFHIYYISSRGQSCFWFISKERTPVIKSVTLVRILSPETDTEERNDFLINLLDSYNMAELGFILRPLDLQSVALPTVLWSPIAVDRSAVCLSHVQKEICKCKSNQDLRVVKNISCTITRQPNSLTCQSPMFYLYSDWLNW